MKDLDFQPQDVVAKSGWDTGSDLELDNFAEAAEQAEAEGLKVLVAGPNDLFFDLDSQAAMDTFNLRLEKLVAIFTPSNIRRWRSKSGKGYHVAMVIKKLSLAEKVAIQAAMGSDPLKELLTIAREKFAEKEIRGQTIRLFQPADAKVQDWIGKQSWATAEEASAQWDNLL
jgi:hypothetical protein